jgi:hypothetical protein
MAFADDARSVARVAAVVAPHEEPWWADSWEALERALPNASCAVVVLSWLLGTLGEAREARLRSLKERCPLPPLVIVTSKNADNALALRWVAAEEVVWLSEVESDLWPAVCRARANAMLVRLAGVVDRALPADRLLATAIAYACRAKPPLRSIRQLAAALACDRRTLWRHWRMASAGRMSLRVEDMLDWFLLLDAVGRKIPGRSWSSIAGELQIHPHTLGRIAGRLAGRPLRTLTAADQMFLTIQCDAHILGALLGRSEQKASRPREAWPPAEARPSKLVGA